MIKVENQTVSLENHWVQAGEKAYEQLLRREDLGFHQLPKRHDLWKQCHKAGLEVSKNFTHLGVLGIGGSSLGVRTLIDALDPGHWHNKITVFDNVDPIHFQKNFDRLAPKLESTHWLVISKSGNTIETLCCADHVLQILGQRGVDLQGRFTVVTEEKDSPLARWAKEQDYPILPVPMDVGGRFSVLTSVGLFPAAFLGLDIEAFRLGASWALEQRALIAELVGQSLRSFDDKRWITLFWSYTNLLHLACYWYQQLWSESLGKALDRKGGTAPRASSPFACLGASDQHSILQQVMEGYRDKFVWFFRCRSVEESGVALNRTHFVGQDLLVGRGMGDLLAAEADATREAFEHSGVPSLTLRLEALGEKELGALFMLLELVVGAIGEAHDINAFDQPGVELGKRLARAKLANQQL